MKKVQLICCIAALSMLVLAGCGETSSSASESAPASSSSSSIAQESSSSSSSSASESSSAASSSSQASSSASSASESSQAASSSASQSPSSASSVPESSQTPSSSSSAADTGSTGTSAPAASTNKSPKERAEALFANDDLDIRDWNTPATSLGAALNQMFFGDADGNILAFFTPADIDNMTANLKAHGYYDPQDLNIGWIKAFNDYRGLETDLIDLHTLDDSLENFICYRYDANTDSFIKFLVPVDGGESSSENTGSDSSSSSASENSNSDSSNDVSDSHTSNESNVDLDEYANEMVDLANSERKKAGVPEVAKDRTLMELAAMRAEELATSYSHTRPNGEGDQYTGVPDYEWVMCNIGRGQVTPEQVVSDWMNSSGHKRNMLYAGHDSVGAGCYQDENGRFYWCIMFYADGGSYPDY